ncbi:MAG: hypothetical protein OSA99_00010 [Acidimicrobiales bacterium]|nr:hypothetical protein [Acidimicrobiales bacterium]
MSDIERRSLDPSRGVQPRQPGAVTKVLMRVRDRLAAGTERKVRASERPHEGWTS